MMSVLAPLSGFLAALASLTAKLASSPLLNIAAEAVCEFAEGSEAICKPVSWLLVGVCFGLVFALNGLMWTVFVSALQASSSTVEVTVLNTTANFLSSALLGWLVFGEQLSLLWWAGASCLLAGLALYQFSDPSSQQSKEKMS